MPIKRIKAENILAQQDISDDLKLYQIFELYKEDLYKNYTNVYYALLGWKDAHLQELFKEQGNGEAASDFKG